MTAEEKIRAHFETLLGQSWVPRSSCSAAFLKEVKPLIDSGVVVEERSGAGRRLAVRELLRFQEFCARRYPDARLFSGATNRVVGVARFRDTKALRASEPVVVSVRAWQTDVLFNEGQPVNAAAATAEHGLFSFLLTPACTYSLSGSCALVENPAVFACLERLNLPVDLAIYGCGRASNRLVDWLAGISAPDFRLIHLPDYDPTGLSEFVRLRARLGERAHLHLPNDLQIRFERFSNRDLLGKANSRAVLANLRHSPVPEIRPVLDLIERHNAGLEQEALLLEYDQECPGYC